MPLADHLSAPCLSCGAGELEVRLLLTREGELPGTPEHDFAYSHDLIAECGACGALRLETWRHDCFDFESHFDRHWRFPIHPADVAGLRSALETCPDPLDPACDCTLHAALRGALRELPPRNFSVDADVGTQPAIRLGGG